MYINSPLASYSQLLYSVEILVNGKPVALHKHENKYFVQANEDSEYEIRIENNQNKRILAVCSIDWLNVIDGKEANKNGGGYVIDGYSNYRIKGYRVSDDKVAAFKFTKKEKSYVANKGNVQNCGVIGVILYAEKIKQPEIIEKHYHHYDTYPWWPVYPYTRPYSPWYIGDMPMSCGSTGSNYIPLNGGGGTTYSITNSVGESYESYSCNNNGKLSNNVNSLNCSVKAQSFDMGSKWGQPKESKVTDITFDRGDIVFSMDIYYASRQSLIDMGIPLIKQGKVSFPESFPNKYCEKPSGWNE